MTKSFVVFAVLGLACIAFAGPGLVHASGCEELLGDNVYRCEVKSSTGSLNDDCLRFNSTLPSESSKFDLSIDLLGDTLGCSCKTTGNFKNPVFDNSKEWVCTTPDTGFMWGGKVAGKGKITKVYAIDSRGASFIFNCVIDPTCTTSGPTVRTLTGDGVQNQYDED